MKKNLKFQLMCSPQKFLQAIFCNFQPEKKVTAHDVNYFINRKSGSYARDDKKFIFGKTMSIDNLKRSQLIFNFFVLNYGETKRGS